MVDNWSDRKSGMICKTCIWFIIKNFKERYVNASKSNSIEPQGDDNNRTVGRCRRHAPTMTGFPVVYLDDWCGDHKLNENAI